MQMPQLEALCERLYTAQVGCGSHAPPLGAFAAGETLPQHAHADVFELVRLLSGPQNQQERAQVEQMLAVFGQSTDYIVQLKVGSVCSELGQFAVKILPTHTLGCRHAGHLGYFLQPVCTAHGCHQSAEDGDGALTQVWSRQGAMHANGCLRLCFKPMRIAGLMLLYMVAPSGSLASLTPGVAACMQRCGADGDEAVLPGVPRKVRRQSCGQEWGLTCRALLPMPAQGLNKAC